MEDVNIEAQKSKCERKVEVVSLVRICDYKQCKEDLCAVFIEAYREGIMYHRRKPAHKKRS